MLKNYVLIEVGWNIPYEREIKIISPRLASYLTSYKQPLKVLFCCAPSLLKFSCKTNHLEIINITIYLPVC